MATMLASAQQSTSSSPDPIASAIGLPVHIEVIRQGHIISAQANAVVAALFAGIQAQLLSGIPGNTNTPLIKALTLFSYAGLVLTIGASLSAMSLLDYLGEVPERFMLATIPANRPATPVVTSPATSLPTNTFTPKTTTSFSLQTLISHEGNPKMQTSYTHCHISLIVGAFSLVVQIALFAWLKSESMAVFVVIIVVCLSSVLTTYPGQMVLAFLSGIVKGCSGNQA